MASITHRLNPSISANKRIQHWNTQVDTDDDGNPISAGDIFEIRNSLGKPAKHLQIIINSGSASFRINPRLTVFPHRKAGEYQIESDYDLWLASGTTMLDSSIAPVILDNGETFSLEREIAITEIEVVTLSGNFRLIVS